ncbi:uncharacterized protein CMU_013770 [Cryptosporidium muris RN66]|uniref:Carrier domain-containing protein n=1 Tax=Cryptosporidium muris (strain RN66) TaxID=441375 RepID=B6AET5_CRYMR|nr:uncharacterized protein CMU_013770 [Cryptosporidium muris RN66]EEA06702.1 hypothetical protein CMU_013770 [Cryptosporidium muris RN66]|eukprot:XP_002141051.1 hypothetical protein [Cryptosporidium muris RN66]
MLRDKLRHLSAPVIPRQLSTEIIRRNRTTARNLTSNLVLNQFNCQALVHYPILLENSRYKRFLSNSYIGNIKNNDEHRDIINQNLINEKEDSIETNSIKDLTEVELTRDNIENKYENHGESEDGDDKDKDIYEFVLMDNGKSIEDQIFGIIKAYCSENTQLDYKTNLMDIDTIEEGRKWDSLDSVELILSIEEHFGIQIPDDIADNIKCVRDIIEAVLNALKEVK